MKNKTTPNYDWINTPPIIVDQNADGSEFIPIGIIEGSLTKLDPHWGDENFRFQIFTGRSGAMLADGSLELIVTYGGRQRRLVGAATMLIPADVDFDDPSINSNYGATIKAECRKNAAKGLGLHFGAGLNDRLTINTPQQKPVLNGRKKPDAVEINPDDKIQQQYNFAAETLNEKAMLVLKQVYPKIQYTGTKKLNHAES